MSEPVSKPPRFRISIAEQMLVAAILGTFYILFSTVLNHVPLKPGVQRPPLPSFEDSLGAWRWVIVPAAASAITASMLLTVRRLLPTSQRKRIVWRHPPRPPAADRELIRTPGPEVTPYTAAASASLAGLGTILLLTVWAHLHVNRRTGGDPVITWEGPFADYVLLLALCGWLFSGAAAALCIYANLVYRSKWDLLAWGGCMLGSFNIYGSCFFWFAAGED